MDLDPFLLLISYAYIVAGFIICLLFSFFRKKWVVFLAPSLVGIGTFIYLAGVNIRLAEVVTLVSILPLLFTTSIWSILIYVYRKKPGPLKYKMYGRAYQLLPAFRFLIYLLLGQRKMKEKVYKEINNVMDRLKRTLLVDGRLNIDLTEGPLPVQKKSAERLVASFVTTRHKKNDFYVQVAQHWVQGLDKRFHRISLLFILLFLLLWMSGVFLTQYIDGFMVFLFLLGIVLFPIVGLVFALVGRGWKKWLLLIISIFNVIVAFMIIF